MARAVPLAVLLLLSGCTVHPAGERAERAAVAEAGRPFAEPFERRARPPLAEDAGPEELVRYALLANAELEQRFWEWQSALEQIPIDGTQATNLALSTGTSIERGRAARERTTLALSNDPMADIQWPGKLSAAARRALENARAAGRRFDKARFELRGKVLAAWYDYALTAEQLRLQRETVALLEATVASAEARNRAGAAGQQDLLRSRNELDLARNESEATEAQLPALRAALNALLGRAPAEPLEVPARLPDPRPLAPSDDQLLDLATARNPELAALSAEIRGRKEGVALARLQYVPDFSLSAGTDLAGIAQGLSGMVTLPLLRHEAIEAAIRQAEANVRASEAMRRQAQNDLKALVVSDLAMLRDADRQLSLLRETLLPRVRRVVDLSRTAYETGHASLLDVLDAQRSLLSLRRLSADLAIARLKRLAELEAATGTVFATIGD